VHKVSHASTLSKEMRSVVIVFVPDEFRSSQFDDTPVSSSVIPTARSLSDCSSRSPKTHRHYRSPLLDPIHDPVHILKGYPPKIHFNFILSYALYSQK
jgi:hypothetical protein